jgi:hypothetical protein
MKKIFAMLLALALMMPLSVNGGYITGANIRGQLTLNVRGYAQPAAGFQAQLMMPIQVPTPSGIQIQLRPVASPAITDYQGMYYIYNINPGQHYVLEVRDRNGAIINRFNISVPPNAPRGRGLFYGIPPIMIR